MSVTAKLTVNLRITETGTAALGGSTPAVSPSLSFVRNLLNGVAAEQIDKVWAPADRTLAASANEDIDVAGSLGGQITGSVVFAEVVGLVIVAAEGNTNNVVVSRPASNGLPFFSAAGDAIALRPGEILVIGFGSTAAGITVTGGTGDLINIANSGAGTGVTYSIAIVGRSA